MTEAAQKFRHHEKDTGSTEVQVSLLTERITCLTGHLKSHRKDFSCQRSLRTLVGRRARLLRYLHRMEPQRYKGLVETLGLRR